MPNYNTQGITSSAGGDPRNLGGSEGYGNPSATSSSGLMSSTSNATANDDDKDEPGFFESIANLFSGAGADLPSDKSDDDGDSGVSFYDGPMFAPYDGGSDDSAAASTGLPFETTAADRALYEALGVDVPEVYTGKMGEEEPEPNLDMDVLQDALQPEPITVEEIEVKAGDTLTAIAEEKGVPVQDVIDANPQIKNPDLIRPGEKVTLPGMLSTAGKLLKTATDPEAPAPVSEDPDREFYQSGIPLEDRFPVEADPRNLGGAEGYGSVGTPPEADTGEGLMTRPKARPTGLDAPDEKERIKAVQTIIGTKADGAFGKGSKAKLKAWQYVHGVPTTGELDEVTMEALKDPNTYDPREITRDNFIQTPTFDLLKGVEGFEEEAYLGLIDAGHKSGLTVGAGLDFGQHTRQALLDKGLPQAMVDKAADAGWIGLNPDTIIDPLTGNPVSQGKATAETRARGETLLKAKLSEQKTAGTFPEFTFEELADTAPIMYKPYEDAAKRDYDRVEGAGSFDALKTGTKAALATEKYHRGESADISYMFNGARADNPTLAAEGIGGANPSKVAKRRRKNMKAWLRKVGLNS